MDVSVFESACFVKIELGGPLSRFEFASHSKPTRLEVVQFTKSLSVGVGRTQSMILHRFVCYGQDPGPGALRPTAHRCEPRRVSGRARNRKNLFAQNNLC
jgi:hypothetical protein